MSNATTLARPYARAAFELAKNEGAQAQWSARLGFAAQVADQSAVHDLLGSPKLQAADRISLFLSEGDNASSSFGRFLAMLESNQRLSLLAEVASLFEKLRADDEKRLQVRVRAAMAIEPMQQQQLVGALAKRFNRAIDLELSIDPELLGGAVVEAGDVVIDGSVRGKLKRLRAELM